MAQVPLHHRWQPSLRTMITPRINQGELHVWWANLRDFDSDVYALQGILSPRERAKAARFRFLLNKKNHIISRGILRTLLGSYVAQSPSDLNFTTGEHGKLELRRDSRGAAIHFNLSHSGDVALYAITCDCPIGVDVEYIRPIPHYERIVLEYFSQSEADVLIGLPVKRQAGRFFNLWTRKEALLKAMGKGLGNGHAIRDAFLLEPGASYFTHGLDLPQVSTDWGVRSFSPTLGYIAAVAFQKPNLDLSCRSVATLFAAA